MNVSCNAAIVQKQYTETQCCTHIVTHFVAWIAYYFYACVFSKHVNIKVCSTFLVFIESLE